MVIGMIGENCSGKSTLAETIKNELGAEVITGKDYLRLAKSESEAAEKFKEKLRAALHGEHIIYVISQPDQVGLLPEGAVKVLVSADLETIKARFRTRMHGVLPAPVEMMLERNHGMFDGGDYDYRYDGTAGDPAALCEALKALL